MYKIFVYNFVVVNYIVEYRIMYISWSANIKNKICSHGSILEELYVYKS